MLQAYSSNLAVAENAAFPFNNITLDKGCAESLSAPATIQLNQRGVYLVEVDGFASGTTGPDTVQLYVNGVALPQAISSFNLTTGSNSNYSFKTLIQVTENNCPCNCVSSPTILQIINGETALTGAHINIIITKLR